jgi:hypothetical protein
MTLPESFFFGPLTQLNVATYSHEFCVNPLTGVPQDLQVLETEVERDGSWDQCEPAFECAEDGPRNESEDGVAQVFVALFHCFAPSIGLIPRNWNISRHLALLQFGGAHSGPLI